MTLELPDYPLPEQWQEVVDEVGYAPALALVEHYGGLTISVPGTFDDDHILVRIMGHEAAAKLIKRYGATRLYVPKLDGVMRLKRDIEIAKKYDAGVSVPRLARESKLSERQIWNILKRPETLQPSPQVDLFE